jgi:thiol peroxidase
MHSITYDGTTYQTYGELPSVGSRAPDVSLVNTELQDVSFANFMGMRKVLNIFPSIDTPVCAKSVVVFNKIAEEYDDVAMLMISYDLPFAHARFHAEHSLENVIGLSAIRHAGFGENYGVQIVEGPLAGMFSRAVVVLDENDTIVHREQIEDIGDEPDYVAAFQALGITVDPLDLEVEHLETGPQSVCSGASLRNSSKHSRRIPARRCAVAAGSIRVTGCSSLHAVVAEEFFDRHAFLPTRLLHDEIQSPCLQRAGLITGFCCSPSPGTGKPWSGFSCLHVRIAGDAESSHRDESGIVDAVPRPRRCAAASSRRFRPTKTGT